MGRRLTVTFDNGPTPGVTEDVLDHLDAAGLAATFFVVGDDLRRPGRRELVAEARARGHRIGNHTLTHRVLLGHEPDDAVARREIDEAQELLGDLAHPDRLFRPWGDGRLGPHLLSPAAVERLERGGYTLALWNCVPRDWEDPDGWVDRALTDIASRDWTVLVLHDIDSGAMARLPDFLEAVTDAGVEFTQELPDECTPIRRGRPVGDLTGLVTTEQQKGTP